ncbi:Flp pilus assembly protein, ATPase CpaF [Amylibacter marinus]|uniref:Flp pilus assembly protein, ATPase CpaF n=1 Tax=Amylibacter marinus TaxID=1475483 RepID=A0ABQ5VRS7_9RHOB|nr:CpaF family protein [Amylibacter marinus]GLQ33793.1 Flp pilus assembly protein, ATPase CpaF [Amylibacter marinus]
MFKRFNTERPNTSTPNLAPLETTKAAKAEPKAAPKAAVPDKALSRDEKRRIRLMEIRMQMHRRLLENLNLGAIETASDTDLKREISAITADGLADTGTVLSKDERLSLNQELFDEVTGLGPLEPLLKDDTINDILINGCKNIFIERAGILEPSDVVFSDENHLRRVIDKIVSAVGRRIDESTPYVDARLSDGSRFNAMVPPIAVDGALVSIRKFKQEKLSVDKLVSGGAFSEEMAAYLQAAVSCRLNILVSGGTGSGKTTTLNALSSFIDNNERIATIEDTAELQLQQDHIARMESRPANVEGNGEVSQRDLLKNALRMRPDRIIVGETRGDEVIDMLQAMNTGHDGSMTTIHANSGRDALVRVENMISMSGVEMPLRAMRAQISAAINIVVQIKRLQDGSRRMVSIAEVSGLEGEVITMQDIFVYQINGTRPDGTIEGRFVPTGLRSHFAQRFEQWGYGLPTSIFTKTAAQ